MKNITMDMGNVGIIRELKLLEGTKFIPHPVRPNEKIRIQCDTPHLLKLLRNRILDEVLWTEINGNRTSLQLEDFEAVLDNDASSGEIRKAFKLSRDHLGKPLNMNINGWRATFRNW